MSDVVYLLSISLATGLGWCLIYWVYIAIWEDDRRD